MAAGEDLNREAWTSIGYERQAPPASGLASASRLAALRSRSERLAASNFRLDDRSVGCGTTHEPDTPEVTDSMQTQEITLLAPLTVSAIATLCTIVMHALVLIAVVHFVLRQERLAPAGARLLRGGVIVGPGGLLP